jgi:hypothetical protein
MTDRSSLTCRILAPLLLTAAACTEPQVDQWEMDLVRAAARWQGAGIDSYDFDISRLCFCAPLVTRTVRVSVRHGAFSGLVYVDSLTPADTTYFADFLTMERFFAHLRGVLAAGPSRFTAGYDPFFGYPDSVVVDPIANAVDDEYALRIVSFTRFRSGAR